jgi:hypothetical protein
MRAWAERKGHFIIAPTPGTASIFIPKSVAERAIEMVREQDAQGVKDLFQFAGPTMTNEMAERFARLVLPKL